MLIIFIINLKVTVNKLLLSLLVSISAVGLTACGGGGGGSSSTTATPATPVTVPLLTAISNGINNGSTIGFSVTGYWSIPTNTITSGSGITDDFPATSDIVNSISYLKQHSVTTGSATALNGVVIDLSSDNYTYYNPSTYATSFVDDSPFVVYAPYTYPSTITTGDSGQFATVTLYTTPAMLTVSGSGTQSYEVLPNTSTSVLVKVTTNVYNTSSQLTLKTISTSSITTAGVMSPIQTEQYRYSASGSTPYYIVYTAQ